jgi:hypothetical protein
VKKAPRPEGQARGKSRAVGLGGQKYEARDFHHVAVTSGLPPIDINAEPGRFRCERKVIRRRRTNEAGQGADAGQAQSQSVSGQPAYEGTKGPPNKLVTGVFRRREDMAKTTSSKTNRVVNSRGSRRPDGRASGGALCEDLPEALPADQNGDYQAMLEQGLRLNRAFIAISDPRVREAIVNLVVEAVKIDSGNAFRLLIERRPKTGLRKPS